MAKKRMAIYDTEPLYGERFAEFVNRKEKFPFTVLSFTNAERLNTYAAEHQLEFLLLGTGAQPEEIETAGAKQVILLADTEVVSVNERYPSIYKYQSANDIMRKLMSVCCEVSEDQGVSMLSGAGRIIGVYSPVNRCFKTSFSLTMGQLLARDCKVLYLNLEDCSGFRYWTGAEGGEGFSDLLYYYGQNCFDWVKLHSLVRTFGELDYILPVRYPEDLCQISARDMAELVVRIARESPYDTLILDMGQFGKKAAEVLEVCDLVYMPGKEDAMSAAKVEEFEEYLSLSGRTSLKDRIRKLKLPSPAVSGRRDNYLEQLLWGELGDYTRQLLRKPPEE